MFAVSNKQKNRKMFTLSNPAITTLEIEEKLKQSFNDVKPLKKIKVDKCAFSINYTFHIRGAAFAVGVKYNKNYTRILIPYFGNQAYTF